MLRALIICPDPDLVRLLESSIQEVNGVGVARIVDHYATGIELNRTLRAHCPDLLFLSTQKIDRAAEVVAEIEQVLPGVQVIGFDRVCEPKLLLEAMRSGIREFVPAPFAADELRQVLTRVAETLEKKPVASVSTDLIFTFLPSKAGVGTSTLAMNTAVALSRVDDTRTLLCDFDMNSGMVRFLLKLENQYCVVDAAQHAAEMDEDLWPQLVTSIGALDVVHAGRINPNVRLESLQIRHLLDFVRRNYRVVCIDLSGNLERYAVELMHESKRIFLVCTPEMPSLHLAREKYHYLRELELSDRVSILLTRCQKRPLISSEEIEAVLGIDIQTTFANDYQGVQRAMAAGRPADPASEFGKQVLTFSHSLLQRRPSETAERKPRFVEYFSILPARYSLAGKRSGA
ncbi:MAG: AAA family ATPase [Acidobacteria bacterium]|nr:AAA family ATPase [Acidobacteriota bacterium]